ncbi:LETM1-related biofilm-associated protein [Psychroflexus sediminis]|uniref:LETM1-like protein n=1 Tax=Psychroflexus sediminis TaxID=470826 RepID=A0A1G7WPY5_9FLAO|nr:LETM1-related biofilm-associated protein [Psychroflexus sediminis]SDG74017.1 LETM1-like protein [Psychroflexus sediminis]
MNPSASGWLIKCLHRISESTILSLNENEFYDRLRKTGFIYGSSQSSLILLTKNLKYTQQELAKINLLVTLVYVDHQICEDQPGSEIIIRLIGFYESLHSQKEFLKSIFKFKTKAEQKLEQLIHKRVQTNEGLIQKNFSHLITNALLFTDVLTYRKSLMTSVKPSDYAKTLEGLIMQTVFLALDKKTNKTTYDSLILKLIKSSLRYHATDTENVMKTQGIDYSPVLSSMGSLYVFDLACMAVYSDEEIEISELKFMNILGSDLNLTESQTHKSIEFLFHFVSEYRQHIAYFHFSNPLNHFYQKNQKAVKLLLSRNKNRLYKEIIQSKELVYLLSQSTQRELNADEKLKVKSQLYDIFKSIPSLAIFVMPGGSVLLPIIIKFIPQLLPSAFNENYEKDE